jgi:type I restriction enzyme S subunit
VTAWPIGMLGEVADLRAGFGFPKNLQGRSAGAFPFAKVGDISRHGRAGVQILRTADNYVDEEDLPILRAKTIPAGSTLFAKIGEAIRQNHRVMTDSPLLIDNNAMAAVPLAGIDPAYLYRFLQTIDLYRYTSSTTVPAVRKSELQQIPIPLAPLTEQRRIAAILDHVDALRAKRREALAQLEELTQAIFVDMFGDLDAGQTHWPETSLGDLLLGIDSGKSPVCLTRSADLDEYGVLKLSAVTTGVFDQNQNKALPEGAVPDVRHEVELGDLLFTRKNTGDLVAASAVVRHVRPKLLIPDLIFRLRIDPNRQIEAIYLQAAMMHPPVRKRIQGLAGGSAGSMPNISKAKLRTVALPHPPQTLQVEFGGRVEHIELLKSYNRSALAELDSLFASLQSQAFHGEL